MTKKLNKLIATSISAIEYPKISKFHTWLTIPKIEEKTNLINRLNEYILFDFRFPESILITENICLKMYQYRFVSSIEIKKEFFGRDLVFDGPEFQQEKYSILFPHIFSTNIETKKPDILSIPTQCDTKLEVNLVYKNWEYKPPAIFNTDIPRFLSAKISANLFCPIGKRNPEGKVFYEPIPRQGSLSGEKEKQLFNEIGGIRKSYNIEKGKYSTTIKELSIWDLIYPRLLPPISFDFKEQFELYSPLYGYQQKGVEFLIQQNSALLADEMGTGKTVQSIIALKILFRQAAIKNALIICPAAVIGSAKLSLTTGKSEGWDGHFYNWAPELSVTVVRGNVEQRTLDWQYPSHIYIATYETIRNDFKNGILKENDLSRFDCVTLDEAQKIKNSNSEISMTLRKIKTKYRWALTGTLIENKTEDLISIFDLVKPKYLDLKHNYSHSELMKLIAPFFLRRLKKEVLKDLPPKIRQEIWLNLDADQRAEYDDILNRGRAKIAETVKSENEFHIKTHIFHLLNQLKQVCNFASEKESSPKTDLLLDFIETIAANKEKVMVFSQYLDYGVEKLERLFDKNEIKYVTYKGRISPNQRQRSVLDFRTQKDIPVLLCTVKSGGIGMNLAEASYVIHFDHWWNPAVMWQAEDRAHRHSDTGKKTGVKKLQRTENGDFIEAEDICLNVYSFWMKDTVEERIKQKLHEKRLLIENIIDSLAEETIDEAITTDEWLDILGVERKEKNQEKESKSILDVLEELKKRKPEEFEIITKELFIKLGYINAKVAKQSLDGGFDIFGTRKTDTMTETIVAQCKRMDIVGVKVARELYGVMVSNPHVNKGFIVTSGFFSEECKRFSIENPKLNLIDGPLLANYLIQFKLA